eukprot:TRINITY_DN77224_c0_g1_i1.p1 TRINITY_DN77224_c0_g1~~TRINITY_DN77224_c0_g1_i1.p1  ORF type:complete len:264 (+),score=37.89 TRINITY_DN77224_c0_g1_i1:80-871(+)
MAASSAAAAFLRDRGARWVMAGWGIFTVENLVFSEYKEEMRRAWGGHGGPKAYQNFYSLCSTAAMGSTVAAYWTFARSSSAVATRTMPKHLGALGFRAAGLIMIGQLMPTFDLNAILTTLGMSQLQVDKVPYFCPQNVDVNKEKGDVYGIARLTRRPELLGIVALGIGGALRAVTAAEVAFFGLGPLLSMAILAVHSDRVQRRNGQLSAAREEQTSNVPFLAMLDGRQAWSVMCSELDETNIRVAVAMACVMALRPPWLRWVR